MAFRFAALALLALLAAPSSAGYLQTVVANSTTGVASFNSSVSGNLSWNLTHLESGAVPAQQAQQAFSNSPGFTATYGNTYGNLTGNFTFAVTLNVNLGVVNNTTLWVTESKSSGFQIIGAPPPAPSPTPPPPQAAGRVRIDVLSPDPDLTHRESLRVEAMVTTSANNSTIELVKMAKERRDPRPNQCAGVPVWKIAALTDSSTGTYSRTWKINDTDDPLPPGTYTVYVNATANDGGWACTVVPDIRVKEEAAVQETPKTPGFAVNATVVATACRDADRACPDGIRGPLEKGKIFYFSLSVEAAVAVCGPTDCERFGSSLKHGFTPKTEGRYCVRQIDPATKAIVTEEMRMTGGQTACWMTGGGFGSQARTAPGLAGAITKPEEIPCSPKVGYLSKRQEQDPETGAVVEASGPAWTLRAGPLTRVTCNAVAPVYWKAFVPTCPLANSTFGLQGTGVLYSRARGTDGIYKDWEALNDFPVPVLCTGTYSFQTMEKGDKPDEDSWANAFSFEVRDGPGWLGFWETLLVVVLSAVAAVVGAVLLLHNYGSKTVFKWRPTGTIYWRTERGYSGDTFTAQQLRVEDTDAEPGPDGKYPRVIPEILVMHRLKTEGRGVERIVRHQYLLGLMREFTAHPEPVFRGLATRFVYSGRPFSGHHHLPIHHRAAAGAADPNFAEVTGPDEIVEGVVMAENPANLQPLVRELHKKMGVWRRLADEQRVRDAELSKEIQGAKVATEQLMAEANRTEQEVAEGIEDNTTRRREVF